MKVLVALVVVAVVAPSVLGAPSGLLGLGLGGAIIAGPSAVSHTSLVQTHPAAVSVIAAPAPILAAAPHALVAGPAATSSLIVGPSGVIAEKQGLVGTVAISGHGLGLGHGGLW